MMQEYAMQYYAIFMMVVVIGVLMRIALGKTVLIFAIVGFLLSLGLGNMVAYVQLRRNFAEIFFLQGHFSLISVYEILYQQNNVVFPLKYANARNYGDSITFHYNDQVITIRRKDWEDFDLIWNWLEEGQKSADLA